MAPIRYPVRSSPVGATLAQLAQDRTAGLNAVVFDPTGEISVAAARRADGDRVLDLGDGLLPGDILTVETFLAGRNGQVLFLTARCANAAMAASILMDYAAHRMLQWSPAIAAALYPGDLAKGPALAALEEIHRPPRSA